MCVYEIPASASLQFRCIHEKTRCSKNKDPGGGVTEFTSDPGIFRHSLKEELGWKRVVKNFVEETGEKTKQFTENNHEDIQRLQLQQKASLSPVT